MALLACAGCFVVAFVVTKYRQSWVILGGAMFWVLGGNAVIWYFGDYANHWVRWSPFYIMVIIACVIAVCERSCAKRRKRP